MANNEKEIVSRYENFIHKLKSQINDYYQAKNANNKDLANDIIDDMKAMLDNLEGNNG